MKKLRCTREVLERKAAESTTLLSPKEITKVTLLQVWSLTHTWSMFISPCTHGHIMMKFPAHRRNTDIHQAELRLSLQPVKSRHQIADRKRKWHRKFRKSASVEHHKLRYHDGALQNVLQLQRQASLEVLVPKWSWQELTIHNQKVRF
jgi:hypothetical protein